MSVANYHRMYLESIHDINSVNIVVYSENKNYGNINEVVNKLITQLRHSCKNVFIYTNIDLQLDGVTVYKMNKSVKDMIVDVMYRENSKFIGFLKTNTSLYNEVLSFLNCANVQYRIYDTLNNKWVIGKGSNRYD